VRRLPVHADDISVDVALSATLPVGTLIPAVTDALVATGNFSIGPAAVRFDLSTPGDNVLDASKTLTELEIRDGTPLTLIRNTVELPTARFDDAAEAVSAAVAAVELRWNRRAARLVSALVASCLAGVSAALLWRGAFGAGDVHRAGCVGVAATISVLAVMASVIAYRIGEGGVGLTSGLTATAFAALAGFVAVPGGPGAAKAVFACAAAATSAVLIRVIGWHAAIFTTLACFAAMCATAASICLVTAAPLPAVGAGLAAVSLALIEASPSISMTLTRLSHASIDDQLHTRAIRAHTWLTGFIAAFSASTALGAICALSEPSLPHILFATVSGSALLLRSPTRHDIRHSAPSVLCGTATLGAALVAASVANPHLALHIASLSMMLSITALYAGFMTSTTTIPSTARRSIELLQYFALAAVAPLALWLCGLYGAVRGLNLP
jgi:type VII secretion integral membrane protein EccD